MATAKLSQRDIEQLLDLQPAEFEKYVSPLLNLANRFGQGTRPKIVGQLSDLIQEFRGQSIEEWAKWYRDRNPESIQSATKIIRQKVDAFKKVLDSIDDETISNWVEDLVIIKTFVGLRFQEAVLKKGAILYGTTYRLATPDEESKNIDGFLGEVPVSIKPRSYRLTDQHPEAISVHIVYYEKRKSQVLIDFGDLSRT